MRIPSLLALPLLLVMVPAPVHAQAARAELTGRVTGADGAALAGAQVTVRAQRTNDARVVVSSDSGFYTLQALPPGGYEVTVELSGFKRFVQRAVTLATGERVRLDVTLAVGGLEETVNVTGEPSTLPPSPAASDRSSPTPPSSACRSTGAVSSHSSRSRQASRRRQDRRFLASMADARASTSTCSTASPSSSPSPDRSPSRPSSTPSTSSRSKRTAHPPSSDDSTAA